MIGSGVTYTPAANYFGSDSFTFKANDGSADSNIATISITVNAVNDFPVAEDQSVSTYEDKAKDITLEATDTDGDALTYLVVEPPVHGTLGSVIGSGVTYTPAANYFGSDSFTFKANDGSADSNTATISITVNAVNDVPVAEDQSVSTNEDTEKGITLAATDTEWDALTYLVVEPPVHGTFGSVVGSGVTYTPAANFFGSDSFTFKANDGSADSNTATISITVNAVNDVPVANDQSVTTNENIMKVIALTGSDVENDLLNFAVVTSPTHGSLGTMTGSSLTYTPATNYFGSDSFTFKVNDGKADSNTATVSITITAVNNPPVAGFSGTPTYGSAPLTVQFTDSSSGVITSYLWNFGDGTTSTLQNPSHLYNSVGTYTVKLTVGNSAGKNSVSRKGYITVNAPPTPVAWFSGTPTSGTAPLSVQFTDASTGVITSYLWNFGDGTTSTLQNPSHLYNAGGTFTVKLTVTGPGGSNTKSIPNYITITSGPVLPPVADFVANPVSGKPPLNVQFNDRSTGTINSWAWSFGDGGTSTSQNPRYRYTVPGKYSVSLTVKNSEGTNTKTITNLITVTGK